MESLIPLQDIDFDDPATWLYPSEEVSALQSEIRTALVSTVKGSILCMAHVQGIL